MFTNMIFREEISISRGSWSGKNHFRPVQLVRKSFPGSKTMMEMVLPPGNDFQTSCTGRKWFFPDQEPLEIEISSY